MKQNKERNAEEEELPRLSLDTIGGGAAAELFQQELDKVLENVLDPNTDPTAKRTITLKITIVPSESRTQAAVGVEADSRLAPFNGASGVVFVGRRMGRAIAVAHDPKQMQMKWDAADKPHVLPGAVAQ